MKISIIVPVYNEEKTIGRVLDKLTQVDLGVEKEILVIDDGSADKSGEIVRNYIKNGAYKKSDLKLITKKNAGKGSAVRLGIREAKGDIITVQDADLEYNPEEYKKLIAPIIAGKEHVIYGSRFLLKHKPRYKIYFWGNKFLTLLTKVLYGSKITDMETCYKVFRSDLIKKIELRSNKFDIEPEVTSKILKKGIKIREIPIAYIPRSVEDGKKINWVDGLQAIYTLFYWRLRN